MPKKLSKIADSEFKLIQKIGQKGEKARRKE